MPESSGREIRQDIADLWTWLVTKLETTVRSINPYITVNWGRFSISGGSFGGAMALELFHEILGCTNNSPLLRVRAMSLRYPVSEYYRREAGEYLGYEATKEEAERSSKEIVLVTKDRSLVIPRASSDPPNGMYGAYISSVSGTWPSFWNEPSTYERIYCMPKPQDKETRIRIIHGTEDKHVLLQDSVNLTKLLRAKGLNVTLCQVEGEAHAFDYDRPLDDRLRAYWDGI
jgi:acetyl esterase/lipase